MIEAQKHDQTFQVFVSRPDDRENDPTKYWKNLLTRGILPAGKTVEQGSGYSLTFYDASQNPDVVAIPGKVGRHRF